MSNIITAGVFDLLHPGHIKYFESIKNKGDKLIVLIHTDRFVNCYKREPILNEKFRLKMVQSLKIVDDAFISDEEYLTQDIINKYNISKVYQAGNGIWDFYYNIPISKNIMFFVEYNNIISTSYIINKCKEKINDENRYSMINIIDNEKLYGKHFQSPCKHHILEKLIPDKTYKNILEVGIGMGGNSLFLQNKYKNSNITGLDISQNMIEISKKNLRDVNVIHKNILDYNNDNNFDFIISRDVFMYCYTEQKYKIFNKINKLLNDNGICLIIDYCVGDNITKNFNNYSIRRNWCCIDTILYKKLLLHSNLEIVEQGNLDTEYITYLDKNKDNDGITREIYDKTCTKLNFMKNKEFSWYYFIVKTNKE